VRESVLRDEFMGYGVRRERWRIAGRTFDLTWPADMDALLDLPRTRERFAADEYMPYWAQPWPAAVLLAEAMLLEPPGEGRTAIEIGCGVGLVSVAAAMQGWRATATDYDPDAVAFADLNARQNGVRLEAATVLDYRVPLERPVYHRVLAADLLYERRQVEPVAAWIASALTSEGMALVGDPNRSAAEGFPSCAGRLGLVVQEQPVETVGPAGLVIRGRIWRVRPRPAGGPG